MPILVAGQQSHTTEASDGILPERPVIGRRLSGEGLLLLYDHMGLNLLIHHTTKMSFNVSIFCEERQDLANPGPGNITDELIRGQIIQGSPQSIL